MFKGCHNLGFSQWHLKYSCQLKICLGNSKKRLQIACKRQILPDHMVQDWVCQGQFHIFWCPGKANCANYFTKHHPDSHHQDMHPHYLHAPTHASANYFACLASDTPDLRFGEGVFISCIPDTPVTKATVQPLPPVTMPPAVMLLTMTAEPPVQVACTPVCYQQHICCQQQASQLSHQTRRLRH